MTMQPARMAPTSGHGRVIETEPVTPVRAVYRPPRVRADTTADRMMPDGHTARDASEGARPVALRFFAVPDDTALDGDSGEAL